MRLYTYVTEVEHWKTNEDITIQAGRKEKDIAWLLIFLNNTQPPKCEKQT